MYSMDEIRNTDAAVAEAIEAEIARQNSHIELIASENWVSKAVMAAMGSPLTNKYAEGYPGHRYYGGCSCVDVVENIQVHRRIWQYSMHCSSQVTLFLACHWHMVDTFPMVRQQI